MRVLSKCISIILDIIIILLVILLLLLYAPRIFGYKSYTVRTGSMLPSYKIGSVIYVKHCEFEDINTNDVISFYRGSKVVTHRVYSVDSENRLVETKGDNNQSVDSSKVSYSSIIGVVKFNIPYIGYISLFMSNI